MRIDWDDEKDEANQRKHGLSFQEARKLFDSGTEYLEIFDVDHSEFEDRFIAIGPIDRGVVVYTEREEETVRIIGARLASKRERLLYRSHIEENS